MFLFPKSANLTTWSLLLYYLGTGMTGVSTSMVCETEALVLSLYPCAPANFLISCFIGPKIYTFLPILESLKSVSILLSYSGHSWDGGGDVASNHQGLHDMTELEGLARCQQLAPPWAANKILDGHSGKEVLFTG